MLSQRNSGQENIILIPNNPNQNIPMNTQNSNDSNNNNSSHNEPNEPNEPPSKEISYRKDFISNNSSMKGGESTTASNALGQKFNKQKRKSSNKSETNLKQILNYYNNENEDNDNNNKDENLGNNNNNNYNVGLEPIMEVPQLTKIEKKN